MPLPGPSTNPATHHPPPTATHHTHPPTHPPYTHPPHTPPPPPQAAQHFMAANPLAQLICVGPIGDVAGAKAMARLEHVAASFPGRVSRRCLGLGPGAGAGAGPGAAQAQLDGRRRSPASLDTRRPRRPRPPARPPAYPLAPQLWCPRNMYVAGELRELLWRAADWCLCPSRFEPCGLVDIEFGWNGGLIIGHNTGGRAAAAAARAARACAGAGAGCVGHVAGPPRAGARSGACSAGGSALAGARCRHPWHHAPAAAHCPHPAPCRARLPPARRRAGQDARRVLQRGV
jgi:hypothetical protein